MDQRLWQTPHQRCAGYINILKMFHIKLPRITCGMGYHYIPIRIFQSQNTDPTCCCQMWTASRNAESLMVGMQNGMVILEDRWFPIQLSIFIPYNSVIQVFGTYLKRITACPQEKNLHKTHLFRVTLYTKTKSWKQPRCSSVGEWKQTDTSRE